MRPRGELCSSRTGRVLKSVVNEPEPFAIPDSVDARSLARGWTDKELCVVAPSPVSLMQGSATPAAPPPLSDELT